MTSLLHRLFWFVDIIDRWRRIRMNSSAKIGQIRKPFWLLSWHQINVYWFELHQNWCLRLRKIGYVKSLLSFKLLYIFILPHCIVAFYVLASSGTNWIQFDNTTTFAKSLGRRRIWQKKKATSIWPLKPWFYLWLTSPIFQVTKAAIRGHQRGKTSQKVLNERVMSHWVCIIRTFLWLTMFLFLWHFA